MPRHSIPNPDTVDWDAPYRPGDNLRVLTPVQKANIPKAERRHLASMPREYRERLEREWLDAEAAVRPVSEPISEEIRKRAAREWDDGVIEGEG